MMKKKWLGYVGFILVICCFIFARKLSFDVLNQSFRRSFIGFYLYLILAMDILFYIGFGVLMGLGNFIKEKEKTGRWKIDFAKLMIIGVPCLIFSFFINLIMRMNIPMSVFLTKDGNTYMTLFRILLGYTAITSFYKESK